jgi:glutamate racemase
MHGCDFRLGLHYKCDIVDIATKCQGDGMVDIEDLNSSGSDVVRVRVPPLVPMKKGSIGIFDSGFGGLDIFRAIRTFLPDYTYLYLADSARAPYGPRSREEVLAFTTEAVTFLYEQGAGLVILACNTASSDALRVLQQEFIPKHYPGRNILGVLVPGAEEAAAASNGKRIGVIATENTVSSGSFVRELTKLDSLIHVFQKACPLLVPMIEAGEHDSTKLREVLKEYITPLLAENIDTLILGCTHYGIIADTVRSIVGQKTKVISEAEIMPEKLKEYLDRHPEYNFLLGKEGTTTFYTTDTTDRFEQMGGIFFGEPITAKHIHLPTN